MRNLRVLCRYRFLAWRRSLRGEKQLARLGFLGFGFIASMNLILSWLLFLLLFQAVGYREIMFRLAAHGLAAAAMALALTSAANSALGSLYEAPYLSIVLAWPVSGGVLYAAGFADATLSVLLLLAGLAAPAWIALGLAAEAPGAFVLAGLAGFAAEALIGTALVSLLITLILRWIGAARLRRILVFGVSAGIVGAILALQLLAIKTAGRDWLAALVRLDGLLGRAAWLPHGLAARSALAAAAGEAGTCWRLSLKLWLLAGLAVAVNLQVGARSYLSCWGNVREASGRAGLRRRPRRRGRPRPVLAVIAKDWWVLSRDPLFLANCAVCLLVMASYAWSMRQGMALYPRNAAVHLFTLGFLTVGWLAQAGAMAISREGSAWWILQAAPLGRSRLVWAKLLFGASGLAGFFTLAAAVMYAAGMAMPPFGVVAMLVTGLVAGLAGAGVLADLILPDFSLRLDVRMTGAHAGGKGKIMLAIAACAAVLVPAGLTFLLAQAALGPWWGSALVLAEGIAIAAAALAAGQRLLDRLVRPEA